MECIKDKCRFCYGHDYFSSVYVCKFGASFKREGESIGCIIGERIRELEREKEILEKYKKFIRFKQPK